MTSVMSNEQQWVKFPLLIFCPYTNGGWRLQSINKHVFLRICSKLDTRDSRSSETQKICAEAVHIKLYSLQFVPARFKNQVMYTKSVRVHSFSLELEPHILAYVPDQYKTKEICNEAMRIRLDSFSFVFDCFKTQNMCIRVAE